MQFEQGNRFINLHIAAGALVFLTIGLLTEVVISLLKENQLERQRLATLDKASAVRARLEGEINSTLHLTRGLIAYVATHPEVDENEFSQLASEIIFVGRNIRNIALARNNVITYIYPLAGNEAALGLEYEKNEAQWPAVKRAIDMKGTVVAGPVELVQGGQAFIARTPIYTRSGVSGHLGKHRPSYWGLASIVINMDELYASAGLMQSVDGISVALRGEDSQGENGALFYGDADIFEAGPVLSTITLPNGTWQMSAIPEGGWGAGIDSLLLPRLVGWMIAILIGFMFSSLLWTREMNKRLALHDHLTGLPNRRLLEDRLAQKIVFSMREKKPMGLIYIDLDGFKQVNDTYGHKTGDELLVETSRRMLASLRASDTVARIGGDEFVMLVDSIGNKDDLRKVCRQLMDNLQGGTFIDGHHIDLVASVGTAIYPYEGSSIDELLKVADRKMYSQKKGSKVRVIKLGK